jgi:hypothetical protein
MHMTFAADRVGTAGRGPDISLATTVADVVAWADGTDGGL